MEICLVLFVMQDEADGSTSWAGTGTIKGACEQYNSGETMTLFEGLLWLTLNVYHEARSEPQVGQVAVALVTLNRANERHLPVKTIVQEPYQFSWTFQKDSYLPDDPKAFLECMKSAYLALKSEDFTHGATHYHLDSVEPYWSENYTYLNQFGSHKFYK